MDYEYIHFQNSFFNTLGLKTCGADVQGSLFNYFRLLCAIGDKIYEFKVWTKWNAIFIFWQIFILYVYTGICFVHIFTFDSEWGCTRTFSFSGHTKVIYVIKCPDISKYSRTELEKLQEIVSTLLNAQFADVIVSGMKNGCVIVTFMIRNCLISKLRALYTPENRSMTCQRMFPLKFKVLKVIIQDEIIYQSGMYLYVSLRRLLGQNKIHYKTLRFIWKFYLRFLKLLTTLW